MQQPDREGFRSFSRRHMALNRTQGRRWTDCQEQSDMQSTMLDAPSPGRIPEQLLQRYPKFRTRQTGRTSVAIDNQSVSDRRDRFRYGTLIAKYTPPLIDTALQHCGDIQKQVRSGGIFLPIQTAAPAGYASHRRVGLPCEPNPSCLLYTSPSPRDRQKSRMPSSA